jgi:hypothetical protein
VTALYLSPESVPTQRLLSALRVGEHQLYPSPAPAPTPTPIATWMAAPRVAASPSSSQATLSVQTYSSPGPVVFAPATPQFSFVADPTLAFKLRAANALATMSAGLIGCLLGAMAYRRARRGVLEPTSG